MSNAQTILDDAVADARQILANKPNADTCRWWRGYLCGVYSALAESGCDVDDTEAQGVIAELYKAAGVFL